MLEILGLAILYAWGHLVYLNWTKLKDLTSYEKGVAICAWVSFILYVIGTLAE